jgi:hypothetical protein
MMMRLSVRRATYLAGLPYQLSAKDGIGNSPLCSDLRSYVRQVTVVSIPFMTASLTILSVTPVIYLVSRLLLGFIRRILKVFAVISVCAIAALTIPSQQSLFTLQKGFEWFRFATPGT